MAERQIPDAASENGTHLFGSLYNYLFCMFASTLLMKRPVLGGALFLAAQIAQMTVRLLLPRGPQLLSGRIRVGMYVLTGVSIIITFGMLLIYPLAVGLETMWLLFSLVLIMTLRTVFVHRVLHGKMADKMSRVQTMLRVFYVMLLSVGVCALILFVSLPEETSWYLLGGFALTCLLEMLISSGRKPEEAADERSLVKPGDEIGLLEQINAYRAFRKVLGLASAALQVTLIMIYTFIGTSANELLLSLVVAFACTYPAARIASYFLRRKQHRDPSNVMLFGLLLWLFSLYSFWQRTGNGATVWSYTSLATCSAGTAVTMAALRALDTAMQEVVFFATGRKPQEELKFALNAVLEYAQLAGQMIALIGLALIVFFGERSRSFEGGMVIQPALLLPAGVMVAFAALAAFRFPLSRQHLDKLHTFLMLKENGETNVPLQKQLESVVIQVSKRHYGIRALMVVLRLFFRSEVQGKEKVNPQKDVSMVFTCNHGELYGPIVSNLYVPFPFRPWSISEMTTPEMIYGYVYENTVSRQKWIPEKLKPAVARFCAPILYWMIESLGSIPVYRNEPRKLINTFRATAEAMEAGDNILIFPENPRDERFDTHYYVREGVGEFYTGFTMVAPLYYKRTGKRCQFVPIYADQKRRTLTFGESTFFDPHNEINHEKHRICDWLQGEMLRMAGEAQQEG